jgi:predicted phage baseplate assembly protein
VASVLKVFVDGVLWTEVSSFFNVPATAHAYVVRQNDDDESLVTFGDGLRACRLSTGTRVTAWYRFGAGATKPPAGGIHQIARPAKGLSSIRNPVAARGGADAEPPEQLRRYAPRSALLLGRAVSLADLEAAAAGTEGVRNVRAEWHWNPVRQTPVAQIFYVGDPAIRNLVLQRLRGLTEPGTQIDVAPATGVPTTLAIQVAIDPAHLEPRVLADVRARLMDPVDGLLAPERIGIGLALFRSRICEFVCSIPGALTVADLQLNQAPFTHWGVSAGTGHYFDFEQGAVLLNGRNQ